MTETERTIRTGDPTWAAKVNVYGRDEQGALRWARLSTRDSLRDSPMSAERRVRPCFPPGGISSEPVALAAHDAEDRFGVHAELHVDVRASHIHVELALLRGDFHADEDAEGE